jgi:hypothetical protein
MRNTHHFYEETPTALQNFLSSVEVYSPVKREDSVEIQHAVPRAFSCHLKDRQVSTPKDPAIHAKASVVPFA